MDAPSRSDAAPSDACAPEPNSRAAGRAAAVWRLLCAVAALVILAAGANLLAGGSLAGPSLPAARCLSGQSDASEGRFVPVADVFGGPSCAGPYCLVVWRGRDEGPADIARGTPVLFVPGHAGSPAMASRAARGARRYAKSAHLSFFSVDHGGELSAFSGTAIVRQAAYAAECIDRIVALYKANGRTANSVMLVGHSMGGLVARYLLSTSAGADLVQRGVVRAVVTVASPLARPLLALDSAIGAVYAAIQEPGNERSLSDVSVVSLATGPRDVEVDSRLTLVQQGCAVNAPCSATLCLPGAAETWTCASHNAAMGCENVARALVRVLDAHHTPDGSIIRSARERVAGARQILRGDGRTSSVVLDSQRHRGRTVPMPVGRDDALLRDIQDADTVIFSVPAGRSLLQTNAVRGTGDLHALTSPISVTLQHTAAPAAAARHRGAVVDTLHVFEIETAQPLDLALDVSWPADRWEDTYANSEITHGTSFVRLTTGTANGTGMLALDFDAMPGWLSYTVQIPNRGAVVRIEDPHTGEAQYVYGTDSALLTMASPRSSKTVRATVWAGDCAPGTRLSLSLSVNWLASASRALVRLWPYALAAGHAIAADAAWGAWRGADALTALAGGWPAARLGAAALWVDAIARLPGARRTPVADAPYGLAALLVGVLCALVSLLAGAALWVFQLLRKKTPELCLAAKTSAPGTAEYALIGAQSAAPAPRRLAIEAACILAACLVVPGVALLALLCAACALGSRRAAGLCPLLAVLAAMHGLTFGALWRPISTGAYAAAMLAIAADGVVLAPLALLAHALGRARSPSPSDSPLTDAIDALEGRGSHAPDAKNSRAWLRWRRPRPDDPADAAVCAAAGAAAVCGALAAGGDALYAARWAVALASAVVLVGAVHRPCFLDVRASR